MKAGPIEVGRLLQNRNRYCVPIYQRHYVWNREKQWEPFWGDVRTKAIERLAGRERRFSHFMGAVVLEARGGYSALHVPTFQVVDGQQRLTTFQLFLAAARDYAESIKHQSAAETIATHLLNRDPHLMASPEVEIFKVWPTQADRALFTDIINLGGRKALRRKYLKYFYAKRDQIYDYSTTPALLRAYGYFYDRIRHSVETDDLDDEFVEAAETPEGKGQAAAGGSGGLPAALKLDALWQSLVEEFKLVEIILEDGDDAQVIFETLNERGEPLLAADLVRNNIFYRAEGAKEKADVLFADHWTPFEGSFWAQMEKQGRYKKARIEFFLSNFIAGQIAGEVNLSKLFSEYKAFIKKRKFASVGEELIELARYGAIYHELIEHKAGTPLAGFSRKLLPWDVTTVFPLVLRLWANAELSEEQKAQCLDVLLSFIVRRAICGLTTKNYNKLFLAAVARLDGSAWTVESFADFLLSQKTDIGRFPRDEEFEHRWTQTPVYSSLQSMRTRAILEAIERSKRTRFHETKELAPSLTVEHFMPQNWEDHWPLGDGSKPTTEEKFAALYSLAAEDDSRIGRIARRIRLANTIGNLTILTQPLNSKVSNGPFEVKRGALKDHSLLVLNRELTAHEAWDEDAIIERSKALFTVAKDLWPLPAGGGGSGAN